jgi:dipeptidyl aminopeptidase/acylaminoacyl peptidase
MRHVVVVALGLALPLGAASAAEPEPDALAPSRGALYALDESGAIARTLVSEDSGYEYTSLAWSPDGRRFAAVDPSRNALVVGTDEGGVWKITQLPAGDGVRNVAWTSAMEMVLHRRSAGQVGYSLWLVSAVDGRARLLTDSAEPSWPLAPQPGGSLLVYTTGEFRRALIDLRSGDRTLLPGVNDVKWSPDGRLLAAVTRKSIDVMRADGTERRSVLAFPPLAAGASRVRSVDWSPDGMRLAFALGREFPGLTDRFGTPVRHEIHTVALDGSGLQQLTGVIGDDLFAGGSLGSVEPSWWPSGARLFFKRFGDNVTRVMNADGSCETTWPGPPGPIYPAWRPGAQISAERLDCSSIVVRARGADEVSFRDTLRVRVTVFNDGTRPLRNVRLRLRTTRGTFDVAGRGCGRGASVVCAIDELPAGRGTLVAADVRFGSTGGTRITASASYAGGADADPADDAVSVTSDVSPCHVLGTRSADRLVGTARGELICGRPGGDVIDARAGNDTILAGSGADTVVAGSGRDRVDGGGGTDTVRVRDGHRDVVDCGSERDVVVADRLDVLRACERVRRR